MLVIFFINTFEKKNNCDDFLQKGKQLLNNLRRSMKQFWYNYIKFDISQNHIKTAFILLIINAFHYYQSSNIVY